MAELGRVEPVRRMQCGHCGQFLRDFSPDEVLAGDGEVECNWCGKTVRLPDDLVDRLRRSRYLGRNLDITG
ncbi:MAG: hypothetical protein AB1758_33960 [Candidatus Eremiobacterota bacterium]